MGGFRRILVPTDFSRHAEEAFRQAVILAKATGAGVMVLHVARPPAVVVDGGRLTTDVAAGEPRDLWVALREIKAEDPGVVVEHEVIVTNQPDASQILKIVEKTGCDLIVMGTHGLTGLKHRLFGGLTEDVVRHARCPVMVVKAHDSAARPRDTEAHAKTPSAATQRPDATSKSVSAGGGQTP